MVYRKIEVSIPSSYFIAFYTISMQGRDQSDHPDQQTAAPSAGGSVLSSYNAWAAGVPFVTRSTLIAISIIGILTFVGLDFSDYLANVPYYTLYYFEIYRILTSIFMSNSIISVVFMWLFFPAMGARMEQQMGSAAFGWMLYASAIAINVVFVALCLVGSMFDKHAMLAECSGFWSVLFTLITLDCLAMPDQPRRLLCIPVDIPGTYFPFALYAFFCFFGDFRLDLALGIAVGFARKEGYLDKLNPADGYLEGLEGNEGGILYNTAHNNEGYIFVQNASYEPVGQAPEQAGAQAIPGFSNMAGFGGAGGQPIAATAVPVEAEAFPGQGSKLSGGGWGGGSTLSKDEAKARRLAALEQQQGQV